MEPEASVQLAISNSTLYQGHLEENSCKDIRHHYFFYFISKLTKDLKFTLEMVIKLALTFDPIKELITNYFRLLFNIWNTQSKKNPKNSPLYYIKGPQTHLICILTH